MTRFFLPRISRIWNPFKVFFLVLTSFSCLPTKGMAGICSSRLRQDNLEILSPRNSSYNTGLGYGYEETLPEETRLYLAKHRASQMAVMQERIQKIIKNYMRKLNPAEREGPFLEIGPYFNPLIKSAPTNPRKKIVYLDLDLDALRTLVAEAPEETYGIQVDLNILETKKGQEKVRDAIQKAWTQLRGPRRGNIPSFRMVAVSSVLNYVDSEKLLQFISTLQKRGDVIVIHNKTGAGDRHLFHRGSITEPTQVIGLLESLGYSISNRSSVAHADGRTLDLLAIREK